MGFPISDGTIAGDAKVDSYFQALRVTLRPTQVLGWYSLGAQTGALTLVAAGGAIFSMRNSGTNLMLIRQVGVGFIATTAFAAAQRVDYALVVARTFTASDTGGTAISLTGNNGKHRTNLATPNSVDCRIATTAALTAGTKVLDGNSQAQIGGWVGAAGAGVPIDSDNLLSHDAGDYPLVLAPNEGFNIQNITVMGAGGVGIAYVNLEYAELTTF